MGQTEFRPWLWLPAALSHQLSPYFIRALALFGGSTPEWRSFSWRGLEFKNRLGVAGGVDKNARDLPSWWALGAGFVEVGTLTPKAQEPNSGPILARDNNRNALWNKMGFPNAGFAMALQHLKNVEPFRTPVFVNIGKNRETSIEAAAEDYRQGLVAFKDIASAYVINISSPNTQGLRSLQSGSAMWNLLKQLQSQRQELKHQSAKAGPPMLLKLSPDMSGAELCDLVQLAVDTEVDGFILTNTTTAREPGCRFAKDGGVSGGPLTLRSRQVLSDLVRALGSERKGRLIVSVGGVLSTDEVNRRLDAGADLVQVYAALVFCGPTFLRRVAREMRATELAEISKYT